MIKLICFLLLSNISFNLSLNNYKQSGLFGSNIRNNDYYSIINAWFVDNIINEYKLYLYFGKYSKSNLNSNKKCVINNSKQAIEFAEIVLVRRFGLKVLQRQPLKAKLIRNYKWEVSSSLPSFVVIDKKDNSKDTLRVLGGKALVELKKSDAKILKIYFEK